MKLKILFSILLIFIGSVVLTSCERSEGAKFGLLQKVSHKTGLCNYYVAEFAYLGGRVETNDKSSSYSNTQEIKITKECADTLILHIGDNVVFDYDDTNFSTCGPTKVLKSIIIKPK